MNDTKKKKKSPVPVTIITGFLGSGKTTLMNRILTGPEGNRIAVIQNEFASEGIDQELLAGDVPVIKEMSNGCICCTVFDDLIPVLEELNQRREDFDRVLIETTGLADPVPVARTFFTSVRLQQDFRLDGIVTLVDAAHLFNQIDEAPEAESQIASADLIVLNKADLTNDDGIQKAKSKIRTLNKEAEILVTKYADFELEKIFEISALHPDQLKTLEAELTADHAHNHSHDHDHHHHGHTHEPGVDSVSLLVEGTINLERLDAWMNMLQALSGNKLYRTKGILNLKNEDRKFIFQSVFGVMQGDFGNPWKPNENRTSKFVLIGKDLNEKLLKDGFGACLDQEG